MIVINKDCPMTTQSILRFTFLSLLSAGLLFSAGSLSADIVNGEKSISDTATEQTPIQVFQFLESESPSLLNFSNEQKNAEAAAVLPYSLASQKALAKPIPEPSPWPFLVFCALIWCFVCAGRRNRTLNPV
jgi:hypothetical protein